VENLYASKEPKMTDGARSCAKILGVEFSEMGYTKNGKKIRTYHYRLMGRFRRVMWSEDVTRMWMWVGRGRRIDKLLRVRIDRRDLG
jgi:hypothetical protein